MNCWCVPTLTTYYFNSPVEVEIITSREKPKYVILKTLILKIITNWNNMLLGVHSNHLDYQSNKYCEEKNDY